MSIEGSYDGEFKRPDHPDFMDAGELKKEKWSGIRSNSFTRDIEIWVLGEKREVVTEIQRALNPQAVAEAFEKVFKQQGMEEER